MRIRLKQSHRFVDDRSIAASSTAIPKEVVVFASNDVQVVPDWIEKTDGFELLEASGHLEVISSPAPTAKTPKVEEPAGFSVPVEEQKRRAEELSKTLNAQIAGEQAKQKALDSEISKNADNSIDKIEEPTKIAKGEKK